MSDTATPRWLKSRALKSRSLEATKVYKLMLEELVEEVRDILTA